MTVEAKEVRLQIRKKKSIRIMYFHPTDRSSWFHATDFLKCMGYQGGMTSKIISFNDRTLSLKFISPLSGHHSWYFSSDILGGLCLSSADAPSLDSGELDRLSFQIADFITRCDWEECETGDAFSGKPPFRKLGTSDMPPKTEKGQSKAPELKTTPKKKEVIQKEAHTILKEAASEAVGEFTACLKEVDEKLATVTNMLSRFVTFQNQQTKTIQRLLHDLSSPDAPAEDNVVVCEQLTRIERVVESLNDYLANRNQDSISAEVFLKTVAALAK